LLAACGVDAAAVQTTLFRNTIDHLVARGGFRGLTIGPMGLSACPDAASHAGVGGVVLSLDSLSLE
jgi:hypothetical protein